MKSWLRFFGLSFFSDNISKEARLRGILNSVLGFVLTLIFIYCGVLAANRLPFYSHYRNSSQFKTFLGSALEQTQLIAENGSVHSDKLVDTLSNENDAALYGVNGYNLVIDTRSSSAFDKFEAYCLSKDGKSEISYEAYLALTEDEQGNYDFKIRYTPEELVLTEQLIAQYAEFLQTVENENTAKSFSELQDKKQNGNITDGQYNESVYALYLKAYYPQMSVDETSGIPLLRTYYYVNYLYKGNVEKCLYIFEDVLLGFFETDGGLSLELYGYFANVSDGVISVDRADGLIIDAFDSSLAVSSNVYLMNLIRFIPLFVAVPLVLALVAKLFVAFIVKDEKYKKYSVCFKIICSYLAVSSLITAVITFICGFLTSSATLNSLPFIIFAVVMAIRTIVYLIYEKLTVCKEQTENTQQN